MRLTLRQLPRNDERQRDPEAHVRRAKTAGHRLDPSATNVVKNFLKSSKMLQVEVVVSMDTVYEFGPFRLDISAEILFRDADPMPVGRRAVAVLRALLERPGRPVSKDALMQAAWSGLTVEEGNLTVQIAALRRVLGDEPGADRWIETLPRRGYRFVGPVTASNDRVLSKPASERAAPLLSDRPSIAVLPFQNMSEAPGQDYFADGMVEDIITALSRIRRLFVIARNSTFTYKGRAVDVRQVGKELGVSYVLEGSVRRVGNRVRISAQLLDATSGAHLWADRFDGTIEDVFDLQDNVASSVAGVIEPTLEKEEYRRSIQRPTDDLTAYDLYLQARFTRISASREAAMRALELVERALERDPNYGSALAEAAVCQCQIYAGGWTNDLKATQDKGIDLARRALRVAEDDPYILANAALALGMFGEDIAAAIGLADRPLQLNPNYARGWLISGHLRLWAGQYDLAIEHLERIFRLSPRERRSPIYLLIGMGHFFARRGEKAAELLDLSLQDRSEWPPTLRFMASCLAHLGRLDEAREMVKRLRAITPVVVLNADHWRIAEDREFFLKGLRLAAGELT
jgi:TolB-like protein/tetratricopeptide (TPR) repeat protein